MFSLTVLGKQHHLLGLYLLTGLRFSHYSGPVVAEQRKSKRFDLNLPVELIRTGSVPVNQTGETSNMSSSGVLFTSENQMSIGDPVEYMVTLPSPVSIGTQVRLRCMGKVMRTENSRTENMESISRRPYRIAVTLERYEFVRSKAN